MSWWQHTKGVVYASLAAIVVLFIVSFFVGSEVRVNKSYVINQPADSVYNFLKQPKNFSRWMDGAGDFAMNYSPDGKILKYEGYQGDIHEFRYETFDKSRGIELNYLREGEKLAVFTIRCLAEQEGTILKYEKVWKLSPNPLVKIVSIGMDEDVAKGMDKDIKLLKSVLNN